MSRDHVNRTRNTSCPICQFTHPTCTPLPVTWYKSSCHVTPAPRLLYFSSTPAVYMFVMDCQGVLECGLKCALGLRDFKN